MQVDLHRPVTELAPGERLHEQVMTANDPQSGLRCVIAIHDTTRGPAFGGCRVWHYANKGAALIDALRLSEGMSYKNALADLPFGGGKAVVMRPPGAFDRASLFTAFGKFVESTGGRYITAEDVGSTTEDMRNVARQTSFVSGLPRDGRFGGDPSPKTAYGVFVAMEQAVRMHLKRSIARTTVAVQGLGAVGMSLCERLHDAGASLVVADIDEARTRDANSRFGARVVSVERILMEPCDVLAPCAMGAVLNGQTVMVLNSAIVCGAANNQLAAADDGDALHDRGVLYLPDFLVNAGGIISVAREYLGQGAETTVMQEIGGIGRRVSELLERSENRAPSRVAVSWAREKLDAVAT